jgi:hypothetical protein
MTLDLGWGERGARPAGDRETIIRNLLAGEYSSPVRIVCFNLAEGWCRDATKDLADEVRRRYVETDEVPNSVSS